MRAKQFTSKVFEAMGDGNVANAVVAEVIKLIGEGHTEVSPDVITTKVSAALGRPFMLKDLVAANNSSPELQHYIDSINPSKIKFSTDILTVKNQDPVKTKEKAEAGVASMASRAASRPRLGESVNEGWGRGNDRVTLDDSTSAYWSGKGPLQKEYDALYNELVPSMGKADTIEGEVLRAASKIVYRHYNDGDEFNQASFDQLKPYIGHVTSYDDLAHKATMFAAAAEGEYHPNPDWDSLDVMEYGPEQDDDDDYDDEDEYWDDEEDETPEWDQDEDEDLDESDKEEFRSTYQKFNDKVKHQKEKSINWPKEVPSDSSQEQDDEDEPHPYGHDLDEGAADRVYTVDMTRYRTFGDSTTRSTSGTIPELLQYFGYTLETGKSYEHERGRKKINMNPKNIQSLVDNLNKAASNAARNGSASTYYSVGEAEVAEARTTWNNDFYVYDPKTKAVKKKFRTHKGAKQYAEANGLKVASAEYYHDSVSKEVAEGWESGPEERAPRERDPDDAYDAQRQEKADASAQAQQAARPQTKVYTLTGRGPNMEPNYKFPGEYATQDEADAARAKLMADPKTPNPRMIGISSHTKFLDEDSVTPLRDLEDYHAKKKALQDIQVDPDTAKDPELNLAVMRRLAGLEKQRSELK